ncbi:MAG: transglutaminase domain-containing protein, partial [Spirochaetes bacterium]|nr:transglutaminase domain-containing protein [Spirochaetota bacterium]
DGEIELDILIRETGRFSSAEEMAAKMLEELGSKGQSSSFVYEGRRAVIAELSFTLDGSPRRGYALFISGSASPAGGPAAGGGYALLAHAGASRFDSVVDFIMSCLDAFSIDRAARRAPGPVSQFLLPWPAPRSDRKTAVLPGGRIELPWSSEEARQELLIVQREYRILTTYLEERTLWIDAWGRFYRMVYRESAARLDSFTAAFARTLPADDPTEGARRVLAWVQDFVFERDLSGLDFVPPLVAAFERRGDCDTRAIVMAIILERLGIDSVLMLSREYSHAMLAVDVPGGGQRFPFKGTEYLVAETTAKVGLGMIDSSQADFSKWLGVDLGE